MPNEPQPNTQHIRMETLFKSQIFLFKLPFLLTWYDNQISGDAKLWFSIKKNKKITA